MEQQVIGREEFTVGGIGYHVTHRPLKFVGEQLCEVETDGPDTAPWDKWTLYRTAKGRLVVKRYHSSRWQGSHGYMRAASFADLANVRLSGDPDEWYDGDPNPGDIGKVPDWVLARFEEALGLDPAEVVE